MLGSRTLILSILVLTAPFLAACDRVTVPLHPADPLAAEIERWSAFLESRPAQDKLRQETGPVLARAEEALAQGKRLLALQRLAAARADLAVAHYLGGRPPEQRKELAAFEAEWARIGDELKPHLGSTAPAKLEDLHPAAARALAEAALPQVRIYYDASLEYGRNTMPGQGLYYLGVAQAQREVVDLLAKISVPGSRREPPLRPLKPELDALESEMLAVYRPPVSIERHGELIAASSTLKEARELDEAGLRYGALLRYLQAEIQFETLRGSSTPPADLAALEKRLSQGDVDHSLGRLFLESGQGQVLPRYFAALEPARPREPGPAPRVTVTLVRWPYT